MYFKSLIFFWLFSVPVLTVDPALTSLFVIKQDTDESGGCSSYLPSPLETWLSDSRALVNAGLQALTDAQDPSAAEYDIARRYLESYFGATDDNPGAVAAVKSNLDNVYYFLNGNDVLDKTPHLYCNDKWLQKLNWNDAVWDEKKEKVLGENPDGSTYYLSIEDSFKNDLFFEDENGVLETYGNVPYWSDDLAQYVFDEGYNGKTYCTKSKRNLATTQEQTNPRTVTLCPSSFTNPLGVDGLGSATPKGGLSIMKVLPRSATFYHELFHLVIGNDRTPDISYSWLDLRKMLLAPTKIPKGYEETNEQLVRQNPETYVFFSVGYWYFQQTQWSSKANERWSFHSGVAQLLPLPI